MTTINLNAWLDVCDKCKPDYQESNLLENIFDGELPFAETESPSPIDATCFICGEPIPASER